MKPKPEKTIEEILESYSFPGAVRERLKHDIEQILCEIVGGDEEIEWGKDIVEQPKEAMEELVKIGRQELRREIRRRARKIGLEL